MRVAASSRAMKSTASIPPNTSVQMMALLFLTPKGLKKIGLQGFHLPVEIYIGNHIMCQVQNSQNIWIGELVMA